MDHGQSGKIKGKELGDEKTMERNKYHLQMGESLGVASGETFFRGILSSGEGVGEYLLQVETFYRWGDKEIN